MTIMAKQLIGFFIVFAFDKATIGKCIIDKTTIDKTAVSRTFLTSLDQNVAATMNYSLLKSKQESFSNQISSDYLEVVAVWFTPDLYLSAHVATLSGFI